MFKPDRYLEHADESPEIRKEDFTSDKDLVEKVNLQGSINNVRYHVSTGIVENDILGDLSIDFI